MNELNKLNLCCSWYNHTQTDVTHQHAGNRWGNLTKPQEIQREFSVNKHGQWGRSDGLSLTVNRIFWCSMVVELSSLFCIHIVLYCIFVFPSFFLVLFWSRKSKKEPQICNIPWLVWALSASLFSQLLSPLI